jgi:hypothetical protein
MLVDSTVDSSCRLRRRWTAIKIGPPDSPMGESGRFAASTDLYFAQLFRFESEEGGRFYSVLIDSSTAEQNFPPPPCERTWLAPIGEN